MTHSQTIALSRALVSFDDRSLSSPEFAWLIVRQQIDAALVDGGGAAFIVALRVTPTAISIELGATAFSETTGTNLVDEWEQNRFDSVTLAWGSGASARSFSVPGPGVSSAPYTWNPSGLTALWNGMKAASVADLEAASLTLNSRQLGIDVTVALDGGLSGSVSAAANINTEVVRADATLDGGLVGTVSAAALILDRSVDAGASLDGGLAGDIEGVGSLGVRPIRADATLSGGLVGSVRSTALLLARSVDADATLDGRLAGSVEATANLAEIALSFGGLSSLPEIRVDRGADIPAILLPAAVGGRAPLVYSVTGLPTGLQFDPATRLVTGRPTALGLRTVTLRCRDAASGNVTLSVPIRVVTASTPTPSPVSRAAGPRRSAEHDLPLGAGDWRGACIARDRVVLLDDSGPALRFFRTSDLARVAGEDVTLPAGNWQAVLSDDETIWAIDDTGNRGYALDAETRERVSSRDLALGAGTWMGGTSDGAKLWILDGATKRLRVWIASTRGRSAAEDVDVSALGTPTAVVEWGEALWVVDNSDDGAHPFAKNGGAALDGDFGIGAGDHHGTFRHEGIEYFVDTGTNTARAFEFLAFQGLPDSLQMEPDTAEVIPFGATGFPTSVTARGSGSVSAYARRSGDAWKLTVTPTGHGPGRVVISARSAGDAVSAQFPVTVSALQVRAPAEVYVPLGESVDLDVLISSRASAVRVEASDDTVVTPQLSGEGVQRRMRITGDREGDATVEIVATGSPTTRQPISIHVVPPIRPAANLDGVILARIGTDRYAIADAAVAYEGVSWPAEHLLEVEAGGNALQPINSRARVRIARTWTEDPGPLEVDLIWLLRESGAWIEVHRESGRMSGLAEVPGASEFEVERIEDRLGEVSIGRWSHESQLARAPGDRGLEFMAQLAGSGIEVRWPPDEGGTGLTQFISKGGAVPRGGEDDGSGGVP